MMKYGQPTTLLLCLLAVISTISSVPLLKEDATISRQGPGDIKADITPGEAAPKDLYLTTYEKLVQPTSDLLQKVNSVIDAYGLKHKVIAKSSINAKRSQCRRLLVRWPLVETQPKDRLISAIKIFQDFVDTTQHIQFLEMNYRNKTDYESMKMFREVEFSLRAYVNEKLRKAAETVIPRSEKSKIPSYKIGSQHKQDDEKPVVFNTNLSNTELSKIILDRLDQLWFCLQLFHSNDIRIEAGY